MSTSKSLDPLLLLLFICSVISHCFMTPGTLVHQAPLSMEFSRQEYCSGLLRPPLGDLSTPGSELMSLALAGRLFTTSLYGIVNLYPICINLSQSSWLFHDNSFISRVLRPRGPFRYGTESMVLILCHYPPTLIHGPGRATWAVFYQWPLTPGSRTGRTGKCCLHEEDSIVFSSLLSR